MTRTPGFTAEVKNNTGFIITEITFGISIGGGPAEMYRVDDFMYQEPGVIYAGLPPDPTTKMRIDSLKSKKFQFELDRPEIDKKKWNWYIAGAKGIVNTAPPVRSNRNNTPERAPQPRRAAFTAQAAPARASALNGSGSKRLRPAASRRSRRAISPGRAP